MIAHPDPQNAWAVVVGIDKYDYGPEWNLDGPAWDAVRFIEWLREWKVPETQIKAFISPLEQNATEVNRRCRNVGVLYRPAELSEIRRVFAETLSQKSGDALLVFWGGHGVVTEGMDRRLFYADATRADKRNLDFSSLLKACRTRSYAGFPLQVGIVDACANYFEDMRMAVQIRGDEIPPASQMAHGITQLVLFASAAGEVAANNNVKRSGAFSEFILSKLRKPDGGSTFPGVADFRDLNANCKEYFAGLRRANQSRQTPVHYFYDGGDTGDGVEMSGDVPGRAQMAHSVFTVIQTQAEPSTVSDVRRFFRGFEVTWSLIKDNVPIPRSIYNTERTALLQEAATLHGKRALRVHVIVGAKGSGKTTLTKQMAFDLASEGYKVLWLETNPRRLHRDMAPEYRRLASTRERTHVFAQLQPSGRVKLTQSHNDHVLQDTVEFVRSAGTNLSLYLEVDTNHFEALRDDMDVLSVEPHVIRVPFTFDDDELDKLTDTLRAWGVAGRLQNRPKAELLALFRRKANKVLLAALIEAIEGVDEEDNFGRIVQREYLQLPTSLMLLYPLVALNDMFGVPIPFGLAVSALSMLPGCFAPTPEHLRTTLREVVEVRGMALSTRHSLIARKLCEVLDDPTPADAMIWLPIVEAILKTISETDPSHIDYLEEFSGAKVPSVLKGELKALADHVAQHRFRNLSDRSTASVMNAVARTYQSRGELDQAISAAITSRMQLWQNENNSADVTLAYCYLSTRNQVEASRLAEGLALHHNNPSHLLHAIRILCRAGYTRRAADLLQEHKLRIGSLVGAGKLTAEVLQASVIHTDLDFEENPWARANWVRLRLESGQIDSRKAIEVLLDVLEDEPNVHRAFTDCIHLLLREGRLDEVLDLTERVEANAGARTIRPGVRQVVNPDMTRSMALGTRGWALVRRDGIMSAAKADELFLRSLALTPDNAWTHNWRGLVSHAVEKGSTTAEHEIREAIRCNRHVPPFHRNLARVISETNVNPFRHSRNDQVIQLCQKALNLCPPESYWNWDGLRCELEAMLYFAESLKGRRGLEGARLAELDTVMSDEDLVSWN